MAGLDNRLDSVTMIAARIAPIYIKWAGKDHRMPHAAVSAILSLHPSVNYSDTSPPLTR
jgi:hypothetical protein